MRDKFTVDFDRVAQAVLPKRAYRLADVEHRLERVAYDLVRFRDNDDTDQLWKVQESPDGPVIIALYGEDGSLVTESNDQPKNDWEAVPDKKALHIYYKGEPLVSLGSADLGIPADEFNVVRRWLPAKLAADESMQTELLGKAPAPVRALIAQRFPELTKVAGGWDDDFDEEDTLGPDLDTKEEFGWEDEENEMRELGDPFRPGGRTGMPMQGEFEQRLLDDEDEEDTDPEGVSNTLVMEVLKLVEKGKIPKEKAVEVLTKMTKAAELQRFAAPTGQLIEEDAVEIDWNPDDMTSEEIIDDDPPNWLRQNLVEPKVRDMGPIDVSIDDEEPEEEGIHAESEVLDLLTKLEQGDLTKDEVEAKLMDMVGKPDIFSKAAAINGLSRLAFMEPRWEDELEETEMATALEWGGEGPPEAPPVDTGFDDEDDGDEETIEDMIKKLLAKIQAM